MVYVLQFDEIDVSQIFHLYLIKLHVFLCRNGLNTNIQFVLHILKIKEKYTDNKNLILNLKILNKIYLLGISDICLTFGSAILFTKNIRLVDVKTAIPVPL